MTGEYDLNVLIGSMEPVLHPETFVFVTSLDGECPDDVSPIMTFMEAEGLTVIVPQQQALIAGLSFEFPCRMITLNIHSALDAVGFLARISTRLAAMGMGVNPVAGFYHDHLFIPEDRALDAMEELHKMVEEYK